MSGGYYDQQRAYAEPAPPPQYMQQSYGQQNPGFPPAYGLHPPQHVSEEYLRQPPTAPYPPAPIHMMPEPMCATQPPPPQEQPRVIIVQPPPPPPRDDCCALASCVCRCLDWLLARLCQALLGFVLFLVLLGLGIWLINKYRHH